MTRIAMLCSALAVTTLLSACGESVPACKTEADLAKLQIDIESKMQKIALDDPEKAMKIAEEMMEAGSKFDLEKAMAGDLTEMCTLMQGVWGKVS